MGEGGETKLEMTHRHIRATFAPLSRNGPVAPRAGDGRGLPRLRGTVAMLNPLRCQPIR